MIQICEAPAVTLPLVLWLRSLGVEGHSFIHSFVGPSSCPLHSFKKHLCDPSCTWACGKRQ